VGPRPGAIVPLESLGVRTTHLDTQRGT